MENVWDVLQKEVPTRIDELSLSLNACVNNITAIRALLSSKAQKYDKLDQLDEAMQVMRANKEMLQIENYLNGVIENLNGSTVQKSTEVSDGDATEVDEATIDEYIIEEDEDFDEEELIDEKTDYSQYLVDNTIAYPVSKNLENTTPYSFSFFGETYRVSNYLQMWVKLCELLYERNKQIFEKIAVTHSLAGRKKAYIVFKGDVIAKNIIKPISFLDTDIILETNTSTIQKSSIILKMLSIYKISDSAIKVYLESDRRPKHGQKPIGKYINPDYDYTTEIDVTDIKTDAKPEVKISHLAYSYFSEYFKDTNKRYDIAKFLDEKWCFDVLGISCPLLKEIDVDKDLKEQTIYGDKNYPSYAQNPKYLINGKTYLICMRWYEIYRDKLEKWIAEQELINNQRKQHIKENCIHYDFKKNICGCVENVLFNQSCSHVDSCKYYSEQQVYVISKQKAKEKMCPCCGMKCSNEMLEITYTKNGIASLMVINRLATLKCAYCEKSFINEEVFKVYAKNKCLDDLSVKFLEYKS